MIGGRPLAWSSGFSRRIGRTAWSHRLKPELHALAAALIFSLSASAQGSSIHWVPDPNQTNKVAVEVSGLGSSRLAQLRQTRWDAAHWQKLLSVSVDQDDLATQLFLPPMLGQFSVTDNALRFDPQFPLQPGVRYRAVFRPHNLPGGEAGKPFVSTFALPAMTSSAKTFITRIFPSAAILPENLLKFYVLFSAPMSRGQIYDHIQLRQASGPLVELPFLQIDEELWDPDMTRLTLFIDPGRIKRGVLPLEQVGPALEAGKEYELVVHHGWKDAAGNPLKETFRKRFTVGPPDRDPPDPAKWKLAAPASHTRDALALAFHKPMDHALAARLIQVRRDSGEIVPGTKTLHDEEQRWLFAPHSPWTPGNYAVAVQTHIEDLAGNNIGKPFEVDLFEAIQRRLTNTVVHLPFSIR